MKNPEQIAFLTFTKSSKNHNQNLTPANHDLILKLLHQLNQLLPHILRPSQRPRLQKVLMAPNIREIIRLPPLINLQQSQMVPLEMVKLRLLLIRDRLLVLRPVKNILLILQHRNNRNYLIRALQINRGQQHLRQIRLQRKVRHSPAQPREQPLVVQRPERVQLLQRGDQRLHRGRVHKVEVQQVVDAHCLQNQHRVRQIGPLYLGHRALQHL